MDRDEVLERIRKGEQYLERTDLTDEQRKAAEERYTNLVALLGTMPEPEEDEQLQEAPGEVQTHLDKIWRTLDPEGKKRKRAKIT